MAALRLVRRWSIPLATAAGAPLLVPVVRAEAGEAKEPPPAAPPTSRMVRPSDLPIYEEPEEVLDFEYHGRERTSLEEGVGVVRQQVEGVVEATRSTRERAVQIYETGKAHSMATVDYLTDEENMLPRAGAITVGGLAGLVIGARRRGGFFKKLLYTSTGVVTAASLCYPRQAYAVSQQLYGTAKSYGAIGYNFVAGVKPQSKAPPPPLPTEAPKEAEKGEETAAAATADTAPETQGAEVRSAAALSLPPGKTLVDTLAEQASDVTVWGFRLTDRDGTTALKATPTKVPEGFGSVGTVDVVGDSAKLVDTHTKQLPEGVREVEGIPKGSEEASLGEEVLEVVKEGAVAVVEKVGEVEEVLEIVEEGVLTIGEKVTEVEEKASRTAVEVLSPVLGKDKAEEVVEGVENVVGEAVQEAAGVLEEHVAPVVEEAAKKVEEAAAMVGGVAEVVAETGEKVESALSLAERVADAGKEAAKVFPAVPEAEVDKVEKMVEETEAVVESITFTAKEVEGVTEVVRKDAEKVEQEATEVMESKEKRKEVVDEVVEFLEAKEQQHLEVVEKQADSTPQSTLTHPSHPKEATLEGQTEVETPPVAPVTPQAEHTQEREGLFDKLMNFFAKPSKGAREMEAAAKVTEIAETASEDKTGLEAASGVPEDSTLVEEKAQSGTEAETHTKQLPESVRKVEAIPKEGVEASLGEEVPEVVKEEATAVVEKVGEVEQMVEEGVLTVGENVNEVEEKASSAVVGVLSPVLGKDKAEEVVEGVKKVVGEGVQEAAGVLEERVAPVVEEAAQQLEEVAALVGKVAEVVAETGEKVESALSLAERVADDGKEAAKVFPAVPEAEVDKVEKMVEETEAVVESVTFTAKEVEGVTEEVRKDAEKVEQEATEVIESKEKRKEVVEFLEAKEQHLEVVEKQADSTPQSTLTLSPHPKEATLEGQTEVETPPVASVTSQAEDTQEREGLFDKLVSFFSKPSKGAVDSPKGVEAAAESASEDKTDRGAASGVPEDSILVEEKAQSGIETETQTRQLSEGVREIEGIPQGSEEASLGEEVLEVVKEGAVAVVEKVGEVEEKVLEIVEEGVLTIGEKVTEVEEKASRVAVEVLSPVLGKDKAEEVVEGVEKVVGEAVQELVETAAGVVEEHVAPVVEETAKQVEGGAALVGEVAETGERVESALALAERVADAGKEAAKVFPAVPEAEVDRVEKMVEETEAVVESITSTAKEVEGVAEEVRKDAEKVEQEAIEVMESKEKRKEVVDEVVEFFEGKEQQHLEVVEKQVDSTPQSTLTHPSHPKEAILEGQTEVETPPVAPVTPQAEHTQEREGLFDKLVSFFSKPSKEEETASELSISSSVGQDTQEMDVFKPESVISQPKPAKTVDLKETTPIEAEGTTPVSETTKITDDEINRKPEPEVTVTVESMTTEEHGPETTEKTESETTGKPEIEIVKHLEAESLETPVDMLKGEKEQIVEEVAEKVQDVEMATVGGDVREEQSPQVAAREGEPERETPEGGESEVSVSETVTVPGKKEGLFDRLVRLITKDDEKPASSSATVPPQEPAAAGVVPVSGEGEEPVIGTPVGEEKALTSAPGYVLSQVDVAPVEPVDTTQVPDVLIKVPEDTAQVHDVLIKVPEDTSQVPDVPQVPEETAQVPDVPPVPEDTTQIPDVLSVPGDVAQASFSPALGKEVPASEPSAEEALPGELPGITLPLEIESTAGQASSSSEGVSGPADILDTKEGKTEDTPLEKPKSEPLTPLPVERKGLFDKLSSLFQKEQQQEPQPPEVPAAGMKEPLAMAQKPEMKMEEDISNEMKQVASPAGEGEAAAVAPVLGSSEEEGSSMAYMEEPSSEALKEPVKGGTAPAGVEATESVSSVGEKEEEAALTAAVETTTAQPHVSDTQVQSSSMMGAELGQQPSVEISGEAPKSVDTAASSMQGGLGVPSTWLRSLTSPKGAKNQDESREHGAEPHVVEAGSVAPPVTESAKDTVVPSRGGAAPGGSQESGGRVSITSEGDTFIVRASPNRPSEVEGEDRWPRGKAGVAVRPSWSRTEATVVEEGKDVIVQLEPTSPEKDYGQSSPEDSDMYTTRG